MFIISSNIVSYFTGDFFYRDLVCVFFSGWGVGGDGRCGANLNKN